MFLHGLVHPKHQKRKTLFVSDTQVLNRPLPAASALIGCSGVKVRAAASSPPPVPLQSAAPPLPLTVAFALIKLPSKPNEEGWKGGGAILSFIAIARFDRADVGEIRSPLPQFSYDLTK